MYILYFIISSALAQAPDLLPEPRKKIVEGRSGVAAGREVELRGSEIAREWWKLSLSPERAVGMGL